MNNRLTLSTLACPDWSLAQIVDACVANGITGIDFRGFGSVLDHSTLPAFSTDAARTAAMLRDHGLSVPCMCSSIALLQPDEAIWKTSIDEFNRYLKMAHALESDLIRIFPGATPSGMPRADAVALTRRHARQLVTLSRGYRAKPALETHDDWSASTDVCLLLQDCAPENFPVIWDVRHTWAAHESPEQVIATLGDRLVHVHVKDSRLIAGHERPTLLGEGVVDVAAALRSLCDHRYRGWICLETEKRWMPDLAPEPEESVPQFARFVRAVV